MKFILATLITCSLLSGLNTASAQTNLPAESPYLIQDSILIPTPNGITISATIARKKTNTQPLPVVLFYTTYHQGKGDTILATRSADRDYVGVVAYARGIRTDMNQYVPYEHEQEDIYHIIDWISKQEWCNGSIGMFGGSYTGFSQWSAAKKLHPALKTIVPQVAVMPGYDFPMQNNVQLGGDLNWIHNNIYRLEGPSPDFLWDWFEKGYAYAKLDSALGHPNKHFQKWLQHLSYDNYWQSLVPTPAEYANINIPVLSTTGYFDGCQISAVQYYQLHHQFNKNANHYLVIGPYDHWGGQTFPSLNLRGYQIDSTANLSMRKLAYEWLDWILKGASKPALLKDKVNFQVMGANNWMHAPTLEKMSNDKLKYYLDDNTLSNKQNKKSSYQKQTIDFADRETMNNYFHPMLIIDSLQSGNGIVYESKPFSETIILNGAFTGQLYVETNKKDFDLSISFYEKTEEGKYFLLSRYLGRAAYARDNTKRQLLTPGKTEQIPLNASHIVSKEIKKNSSIVIVVNVNKHPFEIINYGSGKNPADETIADAGEPMTIKWMNKSYIEIPVWK